MQNDLDLTKMDLTTAMRIAEARGKAERAKETSAFFKAIAASVRGLFSAPVAQKTTQA
ncbi:MAG: hypothetical protein AAGC79_18720 [Pseudomonadota bacterium]